jgi:hypothetical protein
LTGISKRVAVIPASRDGGSNPSSGATFKNYNFNKNRGMDAPILILNNIVATK